VVALDHAADTLFVERQTFRILFWQKLVPLVPLPVFALMLYITPFTQDWSARTWAIVGAVVAGAIAAYVVKQWMRASVVLSSDGLTLFLNGRMQTWPHEKLLKVKDVGRFRARMCYDPDIPDKHMHISFDLFDRDGFVDTLLDWYEETTGHDLPELEEHAKAA
jgi:hypothetical protein